MKCQKPQQQQQQKQINIKTSNGWNNTTTKSNKNENIASTKNFYMNTTINTNSISFSSSILQLSQDEETNT
jgi:hypothetical protein